MAETEHINLVSASSKFEGTVEFGTFTRFDGSISGTLRGGVDSELVLGETGVVEGVLEGDSLIIDGYVRGTIRARRRVVISESGRVIGDIESPAVAVKFGGFFEGKCTMPALPEAATETPRQPAR